MSFQKQGKAEPTGKPVENKDVKKGEKKTPKK